MPQGAQGSRTHLLEGFLMWLGWMEHVHNADEQLATFSDCAERIRQEHASAGEVPEIQSLYWSRQYTGLFVTESHPLCTLLQHSVLHLMSDSLQPLGYGRKRGTAWRTLNQIARGECRYSLFVTESHPVRFRTPMPNGRESSPPLLLKIASLLV